MVKKRKTGFLFLLLAVMLLCSNSLLVLAESVSENDIDGFETSEANENEDSMEAGAVSENVICAGEGSPSNPVKVDKADWSYVYFGSYPQTEVTGKDLTADIVNAAYDENGDAWVNGVKYRRLYSKSFGENPYRYFKWERIKWRVLQNDHCELVLMSDTAIECNKHYDGCDRTWENNEIRSFINNELYNSAFANKEKAAILEKIMVNEDNYYGTDGGNDTKEKVTLLSVSEATKAEWGFCNGSYYLGWQACRRLKGSDYAEAMGLWTSKDEETKGNCWWLLRTVGGAYTQECLITASGTVDQMGYIPHLSDDSNVWIGGIVPVIYISYDSEMWDTVNDGTSGEGGEDRIFTSLQVTKEKTAYIVGEALNINDLKVTANYEKHAARQLACDSFSTNAASIDMNTPGNKTLTVSYTEEGITKTAFVTIQVQQVKVSSLAITAPSKKLAAGKKVKLNLKIAPSNVTNKSVTWKTSNKKYATVDNNGILTLKKAGAGKTVTITVTANDGSKKKASMKIKVMKHAVKSIKLKAPSQTIKSGNTMQIQATVKTTGNSVNETLKWSSSNKSYATVNKKGKVTAKKAGKGKTVTITAQSTDGSEKKASIKLKIK